MLVLSFDTADLTAVPHRKANYCMDRIMMPVDADGTNSVGRVVSCVKENADMLSIWIL
jgi:hypothetical protein